MNSFYIKYLILMELTKQQKFIIDNNVTFINITKYIKLYVLNKISFDKLFQVIKGEVDYTINKEKLKDFIDNNIKKYNCIKDRNINPFTLAILSNEWEQ